MSKRVYIWMAIVCIVILIDLLIKNWIVRNTAVGEVITSVQNLLVVARIETHTMSRGFKPQFDYSIIVRAVFFVLFFILLIRIIMRKASDVFIISLFMIIAGWGGDYIDKLFFSTGAGYQHLDYLSFDLISSAFVNLSFLVTITGWLLLVYFAIFRFKDFKRIFERRTSTKNA